MPFVEVFVTRIEVEVVVRVVCPVLFVISPARMPLNLNSAGKVRLIQDAFADSTRVMFRVEFVLMTARVELLTFVVMFVPVRVEPGIYQVQVIVFPVPLLLFATAVTV